MRTRLHRAAPLTLVGPPDFARQIECRLNSYTWNLLDSSSIDFRLKVLEFDGERFIAAADFSAQKAFRRSDCAPTQYGSGVVLHEENLAVEAVALDHGTPSLGFALRQGLRVNVWRTALDEMGLPIGEWLTETKRAVVRGERDDHLVEVPERGRISLGRLKEKVLRLQRGQVLAYVTGAADTEENRRKIIALADGADQLFIETPFLHLDRALARQTNHLTARAAAEIAAVAHARSVVGFHYSQRYADDPRVLERELQDSLDSCRAVRSA